jgi:hypothetical protein
MAVKDLNLAFLELLSPNKPVLSHGKKALVSSKLGGIQASCDDEDEVLG